MNVTVFEIRQKIPSGCTIWLQTETGEYIEANEAACLSHNHDDRAVESMYPEYYNSLCCTGITVVIQ